MSSFRFQDPIWLWLLIPVIGFGVWSIRRDRRSAVLYSNVELLRGLPVTLAQRFKKCIPWLQRIILNGNGLQFRCFRINRVWIINDNAHGRQVKVMC